MQTNGIAMGHDVIFSITERKISQDLVGLAQSLPQGRLASLRADMGPKNFSETARAGSVFGNGRAATVGIGKYSVRSTSELAAEAGSR
jgi:hypothetical protein